MCIIIFLIIPVALLDVYFEETILNNLYYTAFYVVLNDVLKDAVLMTRLSNVYKIFDVSMETTPKLNAHSFLSHYILRDTSIKNSYKN